MLWKIRLVYGKLLGIVKFVDSIVLCFGVQLQSTVVPKKHTDCILCINTQLTGVANYADCLKKLIIKYGWNRHYQLDSQREAG